MTDRPALEHATGTLFTGRWQPYGCAPPCRRNGERELPYASILDITFHHETFDLVWCAGVLIITADENKALDELTRVTKKGGYIYLLVYATQGMRWPLIERPISAKLGQPAVERAIQAGGLAANKRRTFLDDLFCPKLDFYTWSRLRGMLEKRGFTEINRWPERTCLDHEVSLDTVKYFEDEVAAGRLDNTEAENLVIGQGHHRVLSRRG